MTSTCTPLTAFVQLHLLRRVLVGRSVRLLLVEPPHVQDGSTNNPLHNYFPTPPPRHCPPHLALLQAVIVLVCRLTPEVALNLRALQTQPAKQTHMLTQNTHTHTPPHHQQQQSGCRQLGTGVTVPAPPQSPAQPHSPALRTSLLQASAASGEALPKLGDMTCPQTQVRRLLQPIRAATPTPGSCAVLAYAVLCYAALSPASPLRLPGRRQRPCWRRPPRQRSASGPCG